MLAGIYKITNTITNEFYIGSSKDIKTRWRKHTNLSAWKKCPNNKLYIAFQKYGLDKFSFEILEETTSLKEREQYYIDLLKPVYNNIRAFGLDLEKLREARRRASKKYYHKNKIFTSGEKINGNKI